MKKQVIFRDADMNRFTVEFEIRTKERKLRNRETLEFFTETREISLTGGCDSPLCQCYDHIKPRTEGQKLLIEFWHNYHLNHMRGGTKTQESYLHSQQYLDDCKKAATDAKIYYLCPHQADFSLPDLAHSMGLTWNDQIQQFADIEASKLESRFQDWHKAFRRDKDGNVNFNPSDYHVQCAMLAARGIWNDRGYQYGTEWLFDPIPEDIEDTIDALIEKIEEEEDELTEQLEAVFDMGADGFDATDEVVEQVMDLRDCDEEEAIAFLVVGMHLGVTFGDLNCAFDYTSSSYQASAMGCDYYVGDEDDLEKYASDMVHNDSEYEMFWREAVAAERTTDGLEDWLDSIISIDGWCSVLNHYDGNYHTYRVAGSDYVICRR